MNNPVAELVLEQMAVGDASSLRVKWLTDSYPPVGTKLYTHQYERPHNTVLVPCDKLTEMQAEIEALKAENKSLIAELQEWEDDYEQ